MVNVLHKTLTHPRTDDQTINADSPFFGTVSGC